MLLPCLLGYRRLTTILVVQVTTLPLCSWILKVSNLGRLVYFHGHRATHGWAKWSEQEAILAMFWPCFGPQVGLLQVLPGVSRCHFSMDSELCYSTALVIKQLCFSQGSFTPAGPLRLPRPSSQRPCLPLPCSAVGPLPPVTPVRCTFRCAACLQASISEQYSWLSHSPASSPCFIREPRKPFI